MNSRDEISKSLIFAESLVVCTHTVYVGHLPPQKKTGEVLFEVHIGVFRSALHFSSSGGRKEALQRSGSL